jgi:hypothetical protein
MRIKARLLTLALLAVISNLPIAPAQQPGSVNVRPRVTTPTPGLPTVNVNVDRQRVPLGELVTYTLSPAHVVLNPQYIVTLDFGDGGQTQERLTTIVHLYKAPGTYRYKVSVSNAKDPVKPKVPEVTLFAKPTSAQTSQKIDFWAVISDKYPNIKYRFAFADGWVTGWQDAPQTTHDYVAPKTYLVYVDIGAAGQGRGIERIGRSVPLQIQISSSGPQPQQLSVNLSAKPATIEEREWVTFRASVPGNASNVRYRFVFGDKSAATDWQISPQAKHRYLTGGTYSARVDVRAISLAGVQSASSNPERIEVEATARPDVSLLASPGSVLENMPILLRARLSSPNSNIRYRFNFGDGSRPTKWTGQSVQPHVYTRQGKYAPFVEIARSNARPISPIASSSAQVTVDRLFGPVGPTRTPTPTPTPTQTPTPTPTPTPRPTPTLTPTSTSTPTPSLSPVTPSPTVGGSSPSPTASSPPVTGVTSPSPGGLTPTPSPDGPPGPPDNWWIYLLIALALFAGYQTYRWLTTPRPTFHPRLDPGVSEVGTDKPLAIDLQVELNPDIATGEYGLERNGPSIIKGERKSND